MSTTSGVNVLRYSALCAGVFYGFYHQRSISVSQRSEAAQRAYDHKLELIAKAKAEYAKSKQPASATAKAGGAKVDLNDPNFDIEALLSSFMDAKA